MERIKIIISNLDKRILLAVAVIVLIFVGVIIAYASGAIGSTSSFDSISGEEVDSYTGASEYNSAIIGLDQIKDNIPIDAFTKLNRVLRTFFTQISSGKLISYAKDSLAKDGDRIKFKIVTDSREFWVSLDPSEKISILISYNDVAVLNYSER